MNAKEGAKQVMAIYRRRLEKLDSLAETSRRMGKKNGYLADQLRDSRGLRTQCALESQQVNRVSAPQELYYEALFSLRTDPAGALVYAKEHQPLKPDPFIEALLPRLGALAVAGASSEGDWPSLLHQVRRLDRLRRRERPAAWQQLQALLASGLGRLEAGSRPRRAFGEISVGLGVLAAIYRLAGRRDDAVDLLCHARPLALLANDRAVEAEWYQKAAYLLVDLSYLLRADDFILKAHMFYDEAHSEAERLRTQVDRAYIYYHAKEYEASQRMLHAVLPWLPARDAENRHSAHQLLALNHRALGDIAGARAQLEAAIELVGDDLFSKAYCLTSRADLQVAVGDIAGGLASYRESLPLLAKVTGAAELAEVAMAYAKLLLQGGRRPELQALSADLSGWIHQLKGNYKLRAAVLDFHSLIRADELDQQRFGEILERVAASRQPGRNRKAEALARAQAKAKAV